MPIGPETGERREVLEQLQLSHRSAVGRDCSKASRTARSRPPVKQLHSELQNASIHPLRIRPKSAELDAAPCRTGTLNRGCPPLSAEIPRSRVLSGLAG